MVLVMPQLLFVLFSFVLSLSIPIQLKPVDESCVSVVFFFFFLHHFGILECNSTARRAFNYAVDLKKKTYEIVFDVYMNERTNKRPKEKKHFRSIICILLVYALETTLPLVFISFFHCFCLSFFHSLFFPLQFCMLAVLKPCMATWNRCIVGWKWTQKFWNERNTERKKEKP